MAKNKLKPTDDYLAFSSSGDLRASIAREERNLANELYKRSSPEKTIDDFEKALGIARPKHKANLQYKNRVFSPDDENDVTLLNELMNNPKYSILYWKDNWTVNGTYKVFAIYAEDKNYTTETK